MENKSKTCIWCGIGVIGGLLAVFAFTGVFPGIKFTDAGWETIPKTLGYLGVLALLVERLVEIIISPCRHPEANKLKAAVSEAKSKAPPAQPGGANVQAQIPLAVQAEIRATQDALTDHKAQTHRFALIIGFMIALLASTSGVRLIEPLLDTTQKTSEAVAYATADRDVDQKTTAARRQRDRFDAAWNQGLSRLSPEDITYITTNRVYEMSAAAMSTIITARASLAPMNPATTPRQQWESAIAAVDAATTERDKLGQQKRSHQQLWWLRFLDVLLTAAAMTGGTEPIHKLFTWWHDAREKTKAKT